MKIKSTFIAAFALFLMSSSVVQAMPGDLDPTFGGGGIVVTPIVPEPYFELPSSMQIQPDGKIVVSGQIWTTNEYGDEYVVSFFIVRYLPGGTLDASFGVGGKIVGSFDYDGEFVGEEIALQPDGKILAVGFGRDAVSFARIAVRRYNTNGTPDESFGSGGTVSTSVEGNFSYGKYVGLQPDGKIVVAGYTHLPNIDQFGMALVRYHPDGTLDNSFGAEGRIVTPTGRNFVFVGALLFQPNGKIVLVGGAGVNNLFTLIRYQANGSLDPAFGANGIVQHSIVGPASFTDGILQPDGKIVAVGHSNARDVIIRYNSDGSKDTSFASNGIFLTENWSYYDTGVSLMPDGKVVVFSGSNGGVSILRLRQDGVPDPDFGTGGRVVTPIGSFPFSRAVDGALQPDGKIVAVAEAYDHSDLRREVAIVRYKGDFVSPFDFDGDGKSDLSVYRRSDRHWYLNQSTDGFYAVQFGLSTDRITPGDYDGDGRTDISVFRDGTWYWVNSSSNSFSALPFGSAGDIPQAADYTGDGCDELAVYRNGTWWMLDLASNQASAVQFGLVSDKPVPADYDGDGRSDQTVYRGSGEWYINGSLQGFAAVNFGLATDKPVPADYDGDGKTDIAVFRPSEGNWYIRRSSDNTVFATNWGLASDLPVPGDYDGDGRADIGVYRGGIWYVLQSSNGSINAQYFGLGSDIPVASVNIQ